MRRKVTTYLMAASLAVSMLAGCSSKDNGNETGTDTETAGTAASVAETDTAGSDAASVTSVEESEDSPEEETQERDVSEIKVGVCIYQFADTFMGFWKSEFEDYLIQQGVPEDNIIMMDGENDQEVQNGQVQELIDSGVDVLVVNPVKSSDAAAVTDMAVSAGVPLIYVNREPAAEEEERWTANKWDVTYVGSDARQSGTFQGEIITDLGIKKVDLNGDGKVQYAMIEGDPENIDAEYRTMYSVKALEDADWEVEEVFDEVGNWERDEAKALAEDALKQHPEIEVMFCNNDAMALGALESINDAGRQVGSDIFLVSVDAIGEALDRVLDGNLTGTVLNDYIDQSHQAAQAAIAYFKGEGNDHYIGCDYVKVTEDNAQEILDRTR